VVGFDDDGDAAFGRVVDHRVDGADDAVGRRLPRFAVELAAEHADQRAAHVAGQIDAAMGVLDPLGEPVDIVVNVKEGRTGAFSAGAGFSSADALLSHSAAFASVRPGGEEENSESRSRSNKSFGMYLNLSGSQPSTDCLSDTSERSSRCQSARSLRSMRTEKRFPLMSRPCRENLTERPTIGIAELPLPR